MYQNLLNILINLEIPLSFQEDITFDEDLIIFSIENENDINFSDNKNGSILYKLDIKYKYKDISNIDKYKSIKELLKTEGYIFKKAFDSLDGDIYVKNMIFEYEKYFKS